MSTSLIAVSDILDAQYRPAFQPLLYFFTLWFYTDPHFCSYFVCSKFTISLMVTLIFLLLLSRNLTSSVSSLDAIGLLMPAWNTFASSLWFFQFLNTFHISLWTYFCCLPGCVNFSFRHIISIIRNTLFCLSSWNLQLFPKLLQATTHAIHWFFPISRYHLCRPKYLYITTFAAVFLERKEDVKHSLNDSRRKGCFLERV